MAKKRILIIEDDAIIAMDIGKILLHNNYEVLHVTCGEDGLYHFQKSQFDIIVMDIHLAGELDGIETAEKITQIKKTPIIFLTAYANDKLVKRAKKVEPFGYLIKPVSEKELLITVEIASYKHNINQKLQQNERWKSTILNSIGDAVITTDNKYNINLLNTAAEKLVQCKRKNSLGKNLFEIFQIYHKNTGLSLKDSVLEIIKTSKKLILGEGVFISTKKNNEIPIEGYVAPIIDNENNIDGIVLTFKDITYHKQIEEERKILERQMLQTQKLKSLSTLAGGIAHDFNNLLTIISGNIEILNLCFPKNEILQQRTIPISDSIDEMASLTNQMLTFSQGEKYHSRQILVKHFINDCLPILKYSIKPEIELINKIDSYPYKISGESTQLQLVISAIVTNSSEAIDKDGIIEISCTKKKITNQFSKANHGIKKGTYVSINIKDNGHGMNKESKEKIFDPFYSTKFTGRGMGMASAYGIIKNHNGLILVNSKVNKGTTVSILLPSYEPEPSLESIKKSKYIKGEGTILAIEDDSLVLNLDLSMLEELGYQTLPAINGKKAIEIVENHNGKIDAILLDILLPDISGIILFRHLKRLLPDVKVILCTGFAKGEPAAQELLEAGADAFIQKPFSIAHLSNVINNVLKN